MGPGAVPGAGWPAAVGGEKIGSSPRSGKGDRRPSIATERPRPLSGAPASGMEALQERCRSRVSGAATRPRPADNDPVGPRFVHFGSIAAGPGHPRQRWRSSRWSAVPAHRTAASRLDDGAASSPAIPLAHGGRGGSPNRLPAPRPIAPGATGLLAGSRRRTLRFCKAMHGTAFFSVRPACAPRSPRPGSSSDNAGRCR